MYICVCRQVTENDIIQAVGQGSGSIDELSSQLGIAQCCGQCHAEAKQLLEKLLNKKEDSPPPLTGS